MGRSLADVLSGRVSLPSTWILWMSISTVILAGLAAAILAQIMRRAIEKRLNLEEEPLHAADAERGGSVAKLNATTGATASRQIRAKVLFDASTAACNQGESGEESLTALALTRPLLDTETIEYSANS